VRPCENEGAQDKEGKMKPKIWSYKRFEIREGLKPESPHFQYFYSVSEGSQKKCKYCVWIEDDALATHDPSRDFDAIASRYAEQWRQWVRGKIDGSDFRNLVLKHGVKGRTEIDLEAMSEKLTMD
jgi:hypothetical protein